MRGRHTFVRWEAGRRPSATATARSSKWRLSSSLQRPLLAGWWQWFYESRSLAAEKSLFSAARRVRHTLSSACRASRLPRCRVDCSLPLPAERATLWDRWGSHIGFSSEPRELHPPAVGCRHEAGLLRGTGRSTSAAPPSSCRRGPSTGTHSPSDREWATETPGQLKYKGGVL